MSLKKIAFSIAGGVDRDAIRPIAVEALERGYDVTVTTETEIDADVGIFASESQYTSDASVDTSVIMFHGVDKGYNANKWLNMHWDRFDIGLLPGPTTVNYWHQMSHWPLTRPGIGVFEVGWPKADRLFSASFRSEVRTYQNKLDLNGGRTVLYAPTSEDHGKIHEFVEQARPVADYLLIKHAPYEAGKYLKTETLSEIYSQYEQLEDVRILEKDIDIFLALSLSDILVSDESSVLQEAILTETIPVSVTDWPIRNKSGQNKSYGQIPDFAQETSRAHLQDSLEVVFANLEQLQVELNDKRDTHYAHHGESAEVIMNIVDATIDGEPLPVEPIEPRTAHPIKYRLRSMQLRVGRLVLNTINNRTSDKLKRRLERSSLGQTYQRYFSPYQ